MDIAVVTDAADNCTVNPTVAFVSESSRADENKLISKPYFMFRNQILDGMNVVGKGIIRKFDKRQTNEENIKALNEWVKENKELFKPEFLNKADEYFKEAMKE